MRSLRNKLVLQVLRISLIKRINRHSKITELWCNPHTSGNQVVQTRLHSFAKTQDRQKDAFTKVRCWTPPSSCSPKHVPMLSSKLHPRLPTCHFPSYFSTNILQTCFSVCPRKPSWCCDENFRLLIAIITEWHLNSRGFTLFQQPMKVPTFIRYIQELKITIFRRLATHDNPAICKRTVQSTSQNNLIAINTGNFSDTLVRRVSIPCRFYRNHTKICDIAPRYEVCTAVSVKIWICCEVMPCFWVCGHPSFGETWHLRTVRIQWSSDTAFFQHFWIISALLVTNITKVNQTWQQNIPMLQSANLEQGCCAAEVKLLFVKYYIITCVILRDPIRITYQLQAIFNIFTVFLLSLQRGMRD